jgi:ATP-binding cassette subfamily B protein
VLIDGQDVRDVTQESVRAAIGVVPQDTVLFNDTIRYNIAYGRPGATQAEVEHAARLAQVHDFVLRLPTATTRAWASGAEALGREKQRVAIARTLLKDPRILIWTRRRARSTPGPSRRSRRRCAMPRAGAPRW